MVSERDVHGDIRMRGENMRIRCCFDFDLIWFEWRSTEISTPKCRPRNIDPSVLWTTKMKSLLVPAPVCEILIG